MNTNLTLKKVLNLGGKIYEYKDGRTSYINLNKLLFNNKIKIEDQVKLVVLNFSNCSKIQSVFVIIDENNEDSQLNQIYSATW
jgi:hypothetical protein